MTTKRGKVNCGKITVRLRNRYNVDTNLLKDIVEKAQLDKCEILLILDNDDRVCCGPGLARGNAFPGGHDFDFAFPHSKDRCVVCAKDIMQKDEWAGGVYIPKITAERSQRFKPYFGLNLSHELEHIRIIKEDIEFHRCASWLFDDNCTIFKKEGCDCRSKKTWDFPWELHCNRYGKKVSIELFGKKEFEKSLRALIQIETDEHQEYLHFILGLQGEPEQDNTCSYILAQIQKYYRGLESTAHKTWNARRQLNYGIAKHFDLNKFLPLK